MTYFNGSINATDRCAYKNVILPNISNETYTVKDPPLIFTHAAFNFDQPGCINYYYYSATTPSFVTYNNVTKTFNVSWTADNSTVGTYIITVTITNDTNSTDTYSQNFTLTVIGYNWCLDLEISNPTSLPVDQTYTVNSPALTYAHPLYTVNYPYCTYPNQYSLLQANGSALMSFVTYDNSTGQMSIYSTDNSSAGVYDLVIGF